MIDNIKISIEGDIKITSKIPVKFKYDFTKYILDLYETRKILTTKFYGDFSFLIHNFENGEFFGMRDHLGVVPFYYAIRDTRIFYSTNLKKLINNQSVNAQLDENWIIKFLNDHEEEEYETPYSNIFRLPPAHSLHFKNGQLKVSKYWEMEKPNTLKISRKDACILFKEKLTNAVKQRLPNDKAPIASELSGGVDSTTITGIAAKLNHPIYSFTHAAQNRDDERYLVKDFTSMHSNIHHKLITKKDVDLASDCKWATNKLGMIPRSGVGEWSRQLLQEASNSGSKIIFSGFGGDEGVSQRASSCAHNEFIKNRQWYNLFVEAKNHRPLLWPYTFAHLIYKYLFKSQPLFFDNQVDKRFLKKEFRLDPQILKSGIPRKSTFEYTKYLLPNRRHTAQRLEESYQLAATFGLKYRYPLLDIELIDFFNSLPTDCKLHMKKNRYLFRNELMSDITPSSVRNNYDKGIGGGIIPDLDAVWDTLEPQLNQNFDFHFIDQNYLQKARKNKKLPFPIYSLIACKEIYQLSVNK